jgi:hypothetical protein
MQILVLSFLVGLERLDLVHDHLEIFLHAIVLGWCHVSSNTVGKRVVPISIGCWGRVVSSWGQLRLTFILDISYLVDQVFTQFFHNVVILQFMNNLQLLFAEICFVFGFMDVRGHKAA